MTPKKPRRWLQSAIAEAAKCEVVMPWQRGAVRAETISRRTAGMAPRTTGLPARTRRA